MGWLINGLIGKSRSRRARRLALLHTEGVAVGAGEAIRLEGGALHRIRYEDGTSTDISIVVGKHLGDWSQEESANLEPAKVAVAMPTVLRHRIRWSALSFYVWTNPVS